MSIRFCGGTLSVSTRLFRFAIGRRNDMSGEPWGFWFGWRPVAATPDPDAPLWAKGWWRYKPARFAWKVGCHWYPKEPWRSASKWGARFERA